MLYNHAVIYSDEPMPVYPGPKILDPKMKFYVVTVGRVVGIFTCW